MVEARSISPIYAVSASKIGANDSEIFARVIVPLAVPHILTAVRVAPASMGDPRRLGADAAQQCLGR